MLAQGFEAIHDLDAIVAVAARQDRVAYAAWQAARRIEGQRGHASPLPVPGPVQVKGPASAGDGSVTAAPTSPLAAAGHVLDPGLTGAALARAS